MPNSPNSLPFTYHAAHPAFLVDDLTAATQFYCEVLGFEKKWGWALDGRGGEGEPEVRVGIGPTNGAFEFHLITEPHIGQTGSGFVYFPMSGIDALYARCQEHGVQIDMELTDRHWGMRDFRIADPFGNRLGFGEEISIP